MKTPIAVTLIIMGGLLVMTPAISDYLFQRNVVALMAHSNFTSVNLDGKMGDLYRIGCWVIGCLMVGGAVLCSLSGGKNESQPERLATRAA